MADCMSDRVMRAEWGTPHRNFRYQSRQMIANIRSTTMESDIHTPSTQHQTRVQVVVTQNSVAWAHEYTTDEPISIRINPGHVQPFVPPKGGRTVGYLSHHVTNQCTIQSRSRSKRHELIRTTTSPAQSDS
jgi:hypothetical protein